MSTRTKETTFKLLSSKAFLSGFVPPDYLINGMLQRGFLYGLTGHPGSLKTAIALCIGMHVMRGEKLNDREVKRGRVLFFAGENPDDIRMRWQLMAAEYRFNAHHENMVWCKDTGDFSDDLENIFKQANAFGDVALIVIDTSSAYFPGEDENNNAQARAHWAAMRRFTQGVASQPCVLVLCHPSKNASDLVPRGGSAALGEMDGNITCSIQNEIATIAPHTKFRGVPFSPMCFEAVTEKCAANRTKDGKHLLSVYAVPMKESEIEKAHTLRKRLNERIEELHLQGSSVRKVVEHLRSEFKDKAPSQTTVFRYIRNLEQARNGSLRKH